MENLKTSVPTQLQLIFFMWKCGTSCQMFLFIWEKLEIHIFTCSLLIFNGLLHTHNKNFSVKLNKTHFQANFAKLHPLASTPKLLGSLYNFDIKEKADPY